MEAPVAILAGGGALPLQIAASLARRGRQVRLIALRGFADRAVRRQAGAVHDLVDARGILQTLATWKPSVVTLGGYVGRPGPGALLGGMSAIRNRDLIASLLSSAGDDNLLRGVIGLFEDQGYRVEGVASLAPDLLAPAGVLGSVRPADPAPLDIGMALLGALSPWDIGQAVSVSGARICAVEGPEGTDAMIARVGRLWGSARLPRSAGAPVLVKTAKSGQDLRIDLPVIGQRTIKRLAAAGFAGVAVGAGRTLIVDQPAVIAEADRRGLFVVGLPPADEASLQGELR